MSEAVASRSVFDALREAGGHEDQLICYQQVRRACGGEAPTLDELLKCAQRGTVDGVLESALHLTENDYEILEGAIKREKAKGPNLPKIRRRKRS
jgi:hypothetical protein